ncbi:MAG: hypothetical protein MJ227_03500 [Bacilli bacterium]|nr:hypothetical protein [Bacilli bacterium]
MTKFLKLNKKPNLIESKFKSLLFVGIIGWLVLLIGQVIDNVLAGQFLSEEGLAAVQIIAPFATFISAIGSFSAMGFAIKFSHLKGQSKDDEANKMIGLGLTFTLFIGIIVALIMFFFKEQLLSIFTMTDGVKAYAMQYYDWYVGIAIMQPMFLVLFKVINQDGDPLWTVLSSVGQVLINIIISSILIRYLGIMGLALGTFISICCGIVIVSMHFFTKRNSIKIKPNFNIKNLKDPAKFGFPALLGNISIAIVNLVLNMYITKTFGDAFLASFTVVCFVSNLKLLFGCICDSITAFLSTAKGSGNIDDIELGFKLVKKYSIIVSIIATIITMALCLVIPLLFGIKPDSSQYIYSYLSVLIIAPIFICYAFTINLGASYTAIGKPLITLINQIISNLILPIALPLLLAFFFKSYYGIIAGFSVSAFLSIGIMAIGLAIIHKPHKVFLAPKTDEIQFSENLNLVDEDIASVREDIILNLKINNIEEGSFNRLIKIYDEACITIRKLNPNKVVTVRLTFCISKDKIRLLSKNNGRILSKEEKQNEANSHKEEHLELSNIYETNSLMMSTMISFNSQLIIIPRH